MSVRNGLVVLSLVLSILIGVSLSRSNRDGVAAGSSSDGTVIGLSMDTLKEARWQKDRDLFVARSRLRSRRRSSQASTPHPTPRSPVTPGSGTLALTFRS